MQEINKLLTEKYNLEIKNILPDRGAYILKTTDGRKVLKKTRFHPDRIWFVHYAKEHLYNNNFNNIDRYLCTVEGDPFIDINGETYLLTDAVEGREINFDNKNDMISASKTLAQLHKAARGFNPPDGCVVRDDLGKLPVYFKKRLDEIKRLKKYAEREKAKFDYLFLSYVDYFYSLGEDALNMLNNSKYCHLIDKTREEGLFCHHDYTHNNLLNNQDSMTVINFDYCCYELKVYDLANLLRRKMRKCNWNFDEAKIIIDQYSKIEPLNIDELFVMKTILQFPQKFWRVLNKYYNSRRSWCEKSYLVKLQDAIDEAERHKIFLHKYDKLFK